MSTLQHEESFTSPNDIVNIRVTSGEAKVDGKIKSNVRYKIGKDENLPMDAEIFQPGRANVTKCSTNVINFDAFSLLPDSKEEVAGGGMEYDVTMGPPPPPSPRSLRYL